MLEENQQMQDYLCWTKYQSTIENILNSNEELQTTLKNKKELSQIPALLSKIANYNEAVAKIKTNVSGLSFQIQSTYEQATSCLAGINATVVELFNLQRIVQTLDSLVQSYATKKDHITADNIYTIAAVYQQRLNLERYCNAPNISNASCKPDLFYLHLAALFPKMEAQEKYLYRYLHAANEQELILVRDEIKVLQQQWQEKKESVELFAGDGKDKVSKARIFFLQESGPSWYVELKSEIAEVMKRPQDFFSFRDVVQKEQSRLEEEIEVRRSEKSMEPERWKKLMLEAKEAILFSMPNTIYGRELHQNYSLTKEKYQHEIATQRKKALRNAVLRAKDMPMEILTYEGLSYAPFLEEKQKEVSQLKQMMTALYPAISKNIFEETESLLANPPPPPIHSEEELWNFAYHYGDLVKDKTLGELCTQITGYVDGKCSTLQPLHERVRQIPSINEATFNPDDLRIYQRLHQGLIRYTQDGFKCEKKN